MDFSAFLPFDRDFKEKYGWLAQSYPFAFMLIEKQLRNAESGYPELATKNTRGASRLSVRRALVVLYTLWRLPKSSKPHYYISFERFDLLKAGLSPILDGMGLSPLRGNRNLNKVATLGTAYPRFMRIAHKHGFGKALSNRSLLEKLESQAKKNFERVKIFLAKADVRLFLADGDSLPHARFYCLASRQIGVPYIVFTHGYVQNQKLVSIAPIYCDYLITWTKQQESDLASSVEPADATKIRFFGYPKTTYPSEPCHGLCLIAWNSLIDRDKHTEIEAVRNAVVRAKTDGYRVRLRLHPKDRKDPDVVRRCKDLGVEISENTLERDITEAELVLGSYSSVMIEAAMSGKKVIQLEEFSEFTFEGVTLLAADDSVRKVAEQTESKSVPAQFDYGEFEQFLKGLLKLA